jgi:hypothetical protein
MRFIATACLIAGCYAFQPVQLLRLRALHTRSLSSTAHQAGGESTHSSAVGSVEFDKLAFSVQSEIACTSCCAMIDKTHHASCSFARGNRKQADLISDKHKGIELI